jgi:purine-binding chemotaxis protein CheW
MKESSSRDFDWEAARRRLQQRLPAEELDDTRVRRVLDERARRLATPPADAAPVDSLEVLTFTLSSSRYAIAHAFIHEVVRLQSMTPVPDAPTCVAGVTNHHGNVLPLIDLRSTLGLPSTRLNDLSRIIVLGERSVEFGLLAERTEDTRAIAHTALQRLPGDARGDHHLYRGVTADGLMVLDGAALLADRRFAVGWDTGSERASGDH